MAVGETIEPSTPNLHSAVNIVAIWTKEMANKTQGIKSVLIDFTNKKIRQQPNFIKVTQVPYANTAKYVGMKLDAKLRRKGYVTEIGNELNIKFRKMYWLLGGNSELSIHNKIILYQQVIRPVWSYGI
jgi:hypothetical protein